MAEGQYKFGIALDTKLLAVNINEAKKMFESLTLSTQKIGKGIDDSFVRPLVSASAPLRQIPSQVEQASRSFNGLNVATQQLVRELPAASMGLNTLFLALSNNLPIFADNIKAVAAENKKLAAQGQPIQSVFKQILTSLLSWQTALVAGVTILSMYGKEIGAWVVQLFKGKAALDAVAIAEQTLREVRMQGVQDAQEEVTQLNLKVSAMQNATLSMDERKRAMRAVQEEYPAYFGDLTEEELLYGNLASTVDELVSKMIELASARAALKSLIENEQNMQILENTEGYDEWKAANNAFNAQGGVKYTEAILESGSWIKTPEYEALLDAQDTFLKNLKNGNDASNELFKTIKSDFDRNVGAYISVIETKNEELEESATSLVTSPDQPGKKTREQAEAEAEQQRRQAEAEANARRLREESARLQRDATDATIQAEIDAMDEGIAKKIAAINREYDMRERVIAEREKEIRSLRGGTLTSQEQAAVDALRKSNAEARQRDLAGVIDLDAIERDTFGDMDAENERAEEKLRETLNKRIEAWEDYYVKYGTFQERFKAVQARYAREIAEAETEGERMALEAERDAALAQFEVEASAWAQELVGKTTEQLNKMLEELEQTVELKKRTLDALDSSTSEDAQALRNEINALNAQINTLKSQMGNATESISNDNWADATQVFQNISQAANDAADGLEEFDEGAASILRTIGQLSGVAINLVGAIQGVAKAAEAGAKSISAMEKASVILAVVSAMIQGASMIISIIEGETKTEKTTRELRALNEELRRTQELARIDSIEGTIFGENPFGNFTNNLKQMQDAYADYQKVVEDAKNRAYTQGYAKYIDGDATYKSLADSLYGMVIGTGRNARSLGDSFPELFGEDGSVNMEALKGFADSDKFDQLSHENQELIKELVGQWERYEQAVDSVNDYLKGIFGEMGNEITDALVDSFANGTDAVVAFGDIAGRTIEKLAADMVNAAFIQPIIDEAMAAVEAMNADKTLSSEGRVNALIGIISKMKSDIENQQDEVNAVLEGIQNYGDEQGFDLFSGANRRGATAAGIQVTQDSFDEMSGRVTAIQGSVMNIQADTHALATTASSILQHVVNIDDNTAELKTMRQDMRAMRNTMQEWATRGVKTI